MLEPGSIADAVRLAADAQRLVRKLEKLQLPDEDTLRSLQWLMDSVGAHPRQVGLWDSPAALQQFLDQITQGPVASAQRAAQAAEDLLLGKAWQNVSGQTLVRNRPVGGRYQQLTASVDLVGDWSKQAKDWVAPAAVVDRPWQWSLIPFRKQQVMEEIEKMTTRPVGVGSPGVPFRRVEPPDAADQKLVAASIQRQLDHTEEWFLYEMDNQLESMLERANAGNLWNSTVPGPGPRRTLADVWEGEPGSPGMTRPKCGMFLKTRWKAVGATDGTRRSPRCIRGLPAGKRLIG